MSEAEDRAREWIRERGKSDERIAEFCPTLGAHIYLGELLASYGEERYRRGCDEVRAELLAFMQERMWDGAIRILDEKFWAAAIRSSATGDAPMKGTNDETA